MTKKEYVQRIMRTIKATVKPLVDDGTLTQAEGLEYQKILLTEAIKKEALEVD